MKIMVKYKDKLYRVEQDRRGLGEEADVVITYRATEIFRKSHKKFTNSYDLKDYVLSWLSKLDV